MKSDREFIEGIYRKAEEVKKAELQGIKLQETKLHEMKLQEEQALGLQGAELTGESRNSNPESEQKINVSERAKMGGRIVKLRMLAGAAVAMLVIFVGAAAVRLQIGQKEQEQPTTDVGMPMVRMLPDAYGIDLAEHITEEMPSEHYILTGEVLRVNAAQDMEAVVQITEWLSAAPKKDTGEITVRYRNVDEYGWDVVFAQGEKVLLFLAADEASGDVFYYLQEGSQSKYVFWKEEGKACYYKNAAEVVLDSRVIAANQE